MNILINPKVFLFLVLYLVMPSLYAADGLGRLFTSEEERRQLDYVRHKEPTEEKVVEIEPVEIEKFIEPEKAEPLVKDMIRLKGIVYRQDGKNAAWINESNTYEGDLESQFINVKTNEIGPDQIKITMPDKETEIKLKVGDSYDPLNDVEN